MAKLLESEKLTLVHALEVAGNRFREDAQQAREAVDSPALRSLAEQFERQASEASALLDRLDSADEIEVSP